MQLIGFNFTKISAEKTPQFKLGSAINTNIEFTGFEKEKIEILKDADALRVSFKFSISYIEEEKKEDKNGEILFEGNLVLSATKEESKDMFKSWKKKEFPGQVRLFLFNIILKKCSTKALSLEEDIAIPYHIPMPQLQAKPADQPQK
ncbi:MAG: hypothetical protein AABX07_01405 [Nanoarchaeota archaeon]